MNFLNALEKTPSMIGKYQKDVEKLAGDIPVLESTMRGTWRREEELKELKTEMQTIDRRIQLSLKPIDQGDATQDQVIGIIKYLGSRGEVAKHWNLPTRKSISKP